MKNILFLGLFILIGCAITPYKKSQRISSVELKENVAIVILPREQEIVFRSIGESVSHNVDQELLKNDFGLVLREIFNVDTLFKKSDRGSSKYFDRNSYFDTTYSYKAALTVPSREITIMDNLPNHNFFKSEDKKVKYVVVVQQVTFENDEKPKYRDGYWPLQNWIRTYVKFYIYNFEKKKVINFGDDEVESTYFKKSGYESDTYINKNVREFKKTFL